MVPKEELIKQKNMQEYFLQLWSHESMRVFGDRLTNDEDLQVLDKMMHAAA